MMNLKLAAMLHQTSSPACHCMQHSSPHLETLWEGVMHHKADIRLINAHAKGNGCTHHLQASMKPCCLYFDTLLWGHASMIVQSLYISLFLQICFCVRKCSFCTMAHRIRCCVGNARLTRSRNAGVYDILYRVHELLGAMQCKCHANCLHSMSDSKLHKQLTLSLGTLCKRSTKQVNQKLTQNIFDTAVVTLQVHTCR